jgi:uncharacterized iron-regulated protein
MSRWCTRAVLALVLGGASVAGAAGSAVAQCPRAGEWIAPGAGRETEADILERAARARIVLLGETHESASHHRWQLDVLKTLSARRPGLIVGFEAFPRSVQPALDRWVAGELGEEQFLKAVDWERIWGFDSALYMPLFRFAQRERIRMLALNVSRDTVRAVSRQGLAAVPVAAREGVMDPAPATAAYRNWLFPIYAGHARAGVTPSREDVAFSRFVEVQLLWDAAMAQALAEAVDAARDRPALVVGIAGSGHLLNGHGVPHQLAALGQSPVVSLLPWDAGTRCDALVPGAADAVFGIEPDIPSSAGAPSAATPGP